MIFISVLAYLADAWVLASYAVVARGKRSVSYLNWANAVGCVPISIVEIVGRVWPALILTVTFGIIGVWGLLKGNK